MMLIILKILLCKTIFYRLCISTHTEAENDLSRTAGQRGLKIKGLRNMRRPWSQGFWVCPDDITPQRPQESSDNQRGWRNKMVCVSWVILFT